MAFVKGSHHTEESRRRIAASSPGARSWQNSGPERHNKLSEAMKANQYSAGAQRSKKTRELLSKSTKRRWDTPEGRERMLKDLFGTLYRPMRIEDFWKMVVFGNSCWPWGGKLDEDGYGTLSISRKRYRAHRLSWELCHGPIPQGKWILHHCDNPSCVRPGHLFLGTNTENVADKLTKNRQAHNGRKRALELAMERRSAAM